MGHIVNVAAVQFKWRIEDYRNRTTLQSRINSIMESIRARVDADIPLLAVFPEYIGTPVLLFDSYSTIKDKAVFADAVQGLIMANLPSVLRYKLRYGVSFVRALLLSKSIAMENDYVSIFSPAAKKYNAYIVAGSITLPDFKTRRNKRHIDGSSVYNMSYFFGPDGSLIGSQKKIHLLDFECKSGFDLSKGDLENLKAFDTPFGSVGIAICLDAFKEDVCDFLSQSGADILIQPSANSAEWSEWQQGDWLNGCHLAVYDRKKFRYGINPMMNGDILDLSFEGQSSIVTSEDTSSEANFNQLEPIKGFIKIAEHHNTEEILITTLTL
jgi:predicted amidohydrolase